MPLGDEIKSVYNELLDLDNRSANYDGFRTSFLPWHDKGMGQKPKMAKPVSTTMVNTISSMAIGYLPMLNLRPKDSKPA